jgi:hypothetical protein
LSGGRDSLHLDGAVSSASKFCGLARHNRGLVGTEMGELGRRSRKSDTNMIVSVRSPENWTTDHNIGHDALI